MVGFVGVQSNQFPRAVDLASIFRQAEIPVVIGGFHVSGCLAMLPEVPPDIQAAIGKGIAMFAGEAEGHLAEVLRDAYEGKLKPVYNYLSDLPDLAGAPAPMLPAALSRRNVGWLTSFDAGRGCPFQCSFCTIINVQGRKSRSRSPDDIEALIRANVEQGARKFFITDDDFARNKDWEPILDRLIKLREQEGLPISFTIQVDTLCHKIPRFIDKSARAGCKNIFIGLESINPDALVGAKKRQNKVWEYRRMIQAWKAHGCVTAAGYILGFPSDTPETIARDIAIIQRELPIDLLEFFVLTPLPGSEDHKTLTQRGTWMDPDMNKYDAEHVTIAHPLMSRDEWQHTYRMAWRQYFSLDHIETILRRAAAKGLNNSKATFYSLWFLGCISLEGVHPLEGGVFRRKIRRQRRSGMPIESPFLFYRRRLWEATVTIARWASLGWRVYSIRSRVKEQREQLRQNYVDVALTPVTQREEEDLSVANAPAASTPLPHIQLERRPSTPKAVGGVSPAPTPRTTPAPSRSA